MEQQKAADLFRAQVMTYASSMWKSLAAVFRKFCELHEIGLLNCTPPSLNLFLLTIAKNGKSFPSVESTLASISFCHRFYLLIDITQDTMLSAIKKFIGKVCPSVSNLKAPFGSYEVHKLWDALEVKYSNICYLPFV
jgi:hypothetical protein